MRRFVRISGDARTNRLIVPETSTEPAAGPKDPRVRFDERFIDELKARVAALESEMADMRAALARLEV